MIVKLLWMVFDTMALVGWLLLIAIAFDFIMLNGQITTKILMGE